MQAWGLRRPSENLVQAWAAVQVLVVVQEETQVEEVDNMRITDSNAYSYRSASHDMTTKSQCKIKYYKYKLECLPAILLFQSRQS